MEIIHLTPSAWRVLSETTERVNAGIRPVSDRDHWGVADRWDYPNDGAGHCEDIQLLKRKLLSAAGTPSPGIAHDRGLR
jgi:predicted transglutaminase-like cysteine proteinase